MILAHKPVPGYRSALFVAVAVGVLYLLIIFGRALFF